MNLKKILAAATALACLTAPALAVDVGEVGLFIVDGKGFIKKQGPDRLISLNPESKDIWPGEYSDVRCVGKVLGVLEPEWIISR